MLRGLCDADGTTATPCTNYTVTELVEHLLESLSRLGAMAGATVVVSTGGPPEVRVAGAAQQALEAWRLRRTEGEVTIGDRAMPAVLAADILSIELLVHAWDLAEATSQRLAVSDELVEYVHGLARELIAPEFRDGDRFAAEVEVAADADFLERLVAFTGRTPQRVRSGAPGVAGTPE